MRRRDVLFAACLGAVAAPHQVGAQRRTWRIGVLETAPLHLNQANMAAFMERLRQLGYSDHELKLDYKTSDAQDHALPQIVAELIALKPDILLVRGSPEVLAVKAATRTIPVVMSAVADPVGIKVAESLTHPGGNITGMASTPLEIETKRIGYLKQIVPNLKRFASLADFRNPVIHLQWEEVVTASKVLGLEPVKFDVRNASDMHAAFEAAVARHQVHGVRVGVDGTTRTHRRLLVDLAARNKLPAVYSAREFAEDGGLLSYSPDYRDLYVRAAHYVDRIFKGARPADLPIELPSKFELVINQRAATAIGVEVSPHLIASADQVIE
jgi:putative ABC transport system substrate-binding protein